VIPVKKISRRIFLGTSAAAATVAASQLMTSCRQSQRSTPQSNQEINLYSSRHYNTDTQLYEDFTRQTGIKVNLVEGKADELLERIKSEGVNSPADVLITVDIARLWRAEQAGIFVPVASKILEEKIPSYLRQPQGYWFGFATRARVIMYNKERVKPAELSTYEDLANPKWKGKLTMRSSSNTYNQSLVAALIVAHGEQVTEQWCRGLVANFARPPQGNDMQQIEAVAAGVADLTLANTYYLARYAKSDEPAQQAIFKKIGVFFPNQKERGTHINLTGGGVIKTAPHREAAIQFLEYLATPTAQTFFAQGNYEYPVVKGTPLDPIVASFGSFKADETDLAALGPNLATAVKVMDRAGWK
jgi:iron(III) transport system substrate-binding protein